MSVNPNGEAEVLKVYFKPRPRLKRVIVDLDFATLAIKGRQSQGNLFSRYGIHKIVLKERGTSTLSGQNIWFDEDIRRLNADGRGRLLGEFKGDDKLIVWTAKNQFYVSGFDLAQHFPDDTIHVSRFRPETVYALCYYDNEQQYYYLKRFSIKLSEKLQSFLEEGSRFICLTEVDGAEVELSYKGAHEHRPTDRLDVDSFVGVKSPQAKGKRLSTFDVATVQFIEPERPEPEPMDEEPLGDEELGEEPEMQEVELEIEPETPALTPVEPIAPSGVPLEIDRAKGDEEELVEEPQLNLF